MSTEDPRPDPDALLQRVVQEEKRERAGRFKLFFGFAPGVGKTYAMLESARRLKAQGVDVVVGLVETHGRAETQALLEGLEVLPRRVLNHRGARVEEFDLDAALARKPAVLLLDELAHSNAQGSRHARRYQDVTELLDAGLTVHSTLNVQHVESLNDVVAQVTGVRVRETVPDAMLDRADELELVDLPAGELLDRLRQGKVYLPEQAARAAEHFFRRGNLLALRELALRRAAERVDTDVRAWREAHRIEKAWPTGEHLLVCVGPSPASAHLVRATRRMAAGLRARWTAAYVEPTGSAPLAPADKRRLEEHLRLAERLGASVVHLAGAKVSAELLAFARKHHVTRIVLGKPTHSRLRDLLRGSLVDEVVRGSGDLDVLVCSGPAPGAPSGDAEEPGEEPFRPLPYAGAVTMVGVATVVSLLGRRILALPDVVMLFLLGIIGVALRLGRGPSLLAAALSVASYDFFFVPPYYTFAVDDLRHTLTFAMMFLVGVGLSNLTLRIRRDEERARAREARTATLYALSRELGASLDGLHAAAVLAQHVTRALGAPAAVLLAGAEEVLEEAPHAGELEVGEQELGVARWSFAHRRAAGAGTETLPGATVRCVPLESGAAVHGVLVFRPRGGTQDLDATALLRAMAQQGALALERARLAEEAHTAALRARTEELRSTLLSTVSHDLRTPLAAITGAATTLREQGALLEEGQREELLDSVCEEAERMERLVGNLLEMTRLEAGGLRVRREWVPLEELVGSALGRTEARMRDREVTVRLDPELPLLSVDPTLFEQVLLNLLENAARHTPAGTPLEVDARAELGRVVVEVRDRGAGLDELQRERVFEKFYRGAGAAPGGLGLGLALSRGLVEAHGGTLTAHAREGGGSVFRVTLDAPGDAPAVPSAPPGATERTP